MEEDTIGVPLEFEHLLTFLFGKSNYHGFCGLLRGTREWKKHINKLFDAVRKCRPSAIMGHK